MSKIVKGSAVSVAKNENVSADAAVSRKACYCLGARHRVVTNCIECGYLLCEQDCSAETLLPEVKRTPSIGNPGHKKHTPNTISSSNLPSSATPVQHQSKLICPLCKIECTLPMSADYVRAQDMPESTVKAYAMKDRLLTFDQEHAQRTRVFDAQGDYYAASAWLSDAERQQLVREEAKRLAGKQRSRTGRKINIVLDRHASNRVVDVEDSEDEDEDLERLGPDVGVVQKCLPGLDERDDQRWQPCTSGANDAADAADGDSSAPAISGLHNTALQLQTTKAAETYRYLRHLLATPATSTSTTTAPSDTALSA